MVIYEIRRPPFPRPLLPTVRLTVERKAKLSFMRFMGVSPRMLLRFRIKLRTGIDECDDLIPKVRKRWKAVLGSPCPEETREAEARMEQTYAKELAQMGLDSAEREGIRTICGHVLATESFY